MTLEGAINLNETNDYIIYTMNSVTTGQYGVVVPKNINGTLNMLVDLHMENIFNGVNSGIKTKDQLVSEISDEYNKLKTKYVDGMLVMPMIDEAMFQNIVTIGDKQKMFDEVKKIGAITSELYKKLTDTGIDKQKIDQKIIIVEKSQEDEKFVLWLKEQMPNFVDGILYSELNKAQEVSNPFVSSENIFGAAQTVTPKVEEPVANTSINNGGIFDNVAPVTPVETPVTSAPVEPVIPVSPVVESPVNTNTVPNVDIFGAPTNTQDIQKTEVVNPTVENVVTQNVATPDNQGVPNVTPTVEGPKPVESAMLEGTIAFTPIPNHPNNSVTNTTEVSNENQKLSTNSEKSKGFANLLILLVVLVGVTIASIELGKFLYSVYGA